MKYYFTTTILSLLLTAVSCQNEHPAQYKALTQLSPASKAYKQQLAEALMLEKANITCDFENYSKVNNHNFITVSIQAGELLFKETLLIDNCKSLNFMQTTQGIGYRGARLKGLKLKVIEGMKGAMLQLTGVKQIVD